MKVKRKDVFKKILDFLPNKRSGEGEDTIAMSDSKKSDTEPTTQSSVAPKTMKKKGLNAADIVMVVGLVGILGGLFWVITGGLEEPAVPKTQKAKTTTPKPVAKAQEIPPQPPKDPAPQTAPYYEESKVVESTPNTPAVSDNPMVVNTAEETPPFVYGNEANFGNENLAPPPESYEKNLTKIAKKIAVQKPKNRAMESRPQAVAVEQRAPQATTAATQSRREAVNPQSPPIVSKAVEPATQPVVATAQSSYVCSMMQGYRDMVGKEIMYYLKDPATQKYLPAYSQKNWDESGIWLKEKFIVSQVDLDERMVEVRAGKWIPALEFMTCTLIEESRR